MKNNLAWIYPHNELYYFPGKIINSSKIDNTVELKDIESNELYRQKLSEIIYINNENFNEIKKINDLLCLDELNEGILLTSLRERFKNKLIYTQIGEPILIAINPFQRLEIYSDNNRKSYNTDNLNELAPHLFKLGQKSFNNLKKGENSQSIIITGESGAGKTESVKYLLRYFAKLENNLNSNEDSIENKILSTNPILESFGNARTLRNDNSSRFGKYLEIYFDKNTNKISHASITNYLLEQSRIISQSVNERNYHIFYLVTLVTDMEFKKKYKLVDEDDNEYDFSKIINMDYDRYEETLTDDEELYKDTLTNMKLIGFNNSKINDIFKIISSVLHLSRLKIINKNKEEFTVEDSISLNITCEFLGIKKIDFIELICCKKMIDPLNKETIIKPLNEKDCNIGISTFLKIIYSKLFDHLIFLINKSIYNSKQAKNKYNIISLLDIFGFEIFPNNSFEQLCINFTNEKLQQHFNEHMFILEKKIYKEENIDFNFKDLPDNKNIISLIENKGGLFDLLDEQNKIGKGNYKKFINNLDSTFIKNPNYISKQNTINKNYFGIKHFAGEVDYDTEFFVEKNQNNVNKELNDILSESTNSTIKEIFKNSKSNKNNPSVSTIFKKQLNDLMVNLNKSRSLYVRCIKPNNERSSEIFENKEICRQLRCGGILEAVKVRKSGYGIRKKYEELVTKWNSLIKLYKHKENNSKGIIVNLINNLKKEKISKEFHNQFAFGNTKLFMKETFIQQIDSLINDIEEEFALKIQKVYKGYIEKTRYKKIKIFIIIIQRNIKKFIKKIKIRHKLKITKNIIKIYNFENNFNILLENIEKLKNDKIAKEDNNLTINDIEFNNKNLENRKFNIVKENEINSSFIINEDKNNIKNLDEDINIYESNISISKKKLNFKLDNIIKSEIQNEKINNQNTNNNNYFKKELANKSSIINDLKDKWANQAFKLNTYKNGIRKYKEKIKNLENQIIEYENSSIYDKIEKVDMILEEKNSEIEKLKYMYNELKQEKEEKEENESQDKILKLLLHYFKWNQNKKNIKNIIKKDNNPKLKENYDKLKTGMESLNIKINNEIKNMLIRQKKNEINNHGEDEYEDEDGEEEEYEEDDEEYEEDEEDEEENFEISQSNNLGYNGKLNITTN